MRPKTRWRVLIGITAGAFALPSGVGWATMLSTTTYRSKSKTAPVEYAVTATWMRPRNSRLPRTWWLHSLHLHPDGRWLITDEAVSGAPKWQRPFQHGFGSRVRLRSLSRLAPIRELPAVARVLALSTDGTRLLGLDRQGWAAIWDTRNWRRIRRFAPAALEPAQGVFSSTGREVAFVGRGREVSVWETASGQRMARIPNAIQVYGFVQPGPALLVSTGGGYFAHSLRQSENARYLKDLGYYWGGLTVSGDGALVAGQSRGEELFIWRADRWQVSRRVKLKQEPEMQLAWSSDGGTLIQAGTDGAVWHINAATGTSSRIYTRRAIHLQLSTSRKAALVAVAHPEGIVLLKRKR